MIQRIQSIYLLVTAILMAVTVCSPLLILQTANEIYTFKCLGIYQESFEPIYWTWGVISIAILCTVLSFLNIFLFKKRRIQLKVSNLVSLMIVIFYVTTGVYFHSSKAELGTELQSLSYGAILPLIALVVNILATVSIKKDEKLVQSLNRIR